MTRTQHTPVDFDAIHHLIEELSEHGRSDDEENLNNLLMERVDLLLKVSYYHTQCDEIAGKCADLLAALEDARAELDISMMEHEPDSIQYEALAEAIAKIDAVLAKARG